MLIIGALLAVVMSSGFMYIYNSQQIRAEESYYELAKSHNLDLAMIRHTISKQGGTYVKKGENTQTNPYLVNIPNLKTDIQDSEGNNYTLLNSFSFIREMTEEMNSMNEMEDKNKFINYRVPSTMALNPINDPTDFENEILAKMDSGEILEYTSMGIDENGSRIYTYMSPVFADKKCLKCHDYGGKVDGVVGVCSITIPVEEAEMKKEAAMKNILFLFVGAGFFVMGAVYHISNHISDPIVRLSGAGERIRNGEHGITIDSSTRIDEIHNLGTVFNQLTEDLQEKIDQLSIDISRRKIAESELIESKRDLDKAFQRMSAIFHGSGDGMRIIDTEFNIIEQNKVMDEICRINEGEAKGKRCKDMLYGSVCEGEDCTLARILAGEEKVKEEAIKKLPDGSTVPVSVTATPLKDSRGNIIGIIESFRDITERKNAERNLKESQEKYRDLLENANDLIQSLDIEGKFLFVNKKWLDKLGYTRDDIEDLRFNDIISPEFLNHCMGILERVMNGEIIENEEIIFLTKNGEKIFVEGNINGIFKEGNFIASRGIFRDITERKMIEEAAFLASLTENSYDAIASLDMDGCFTSWNMGAEEIFGYEKEEIMGEPINKIIAPEDRSKCLEIFEIAEEIGFNRGAETNCLARNGRKVPVELTLSLLKNKIGKKIGYTLILRDISNRRLMEMELYKKQTDLIRINGELGSKNLELEKSNMLKDLFTDIMRHDLINPAGIIKTSAELAIDDGFENEEIHSICNAVNKLITMIENASAFSKLENAEEIEFLQLDIKKILDEICENLRPCFSGSGIEVQCNIHETMPILANPMIEDVFLNLLSNVLKYAPEGKKVILDARDIGEKYRISVTDFGKGIPNEHKEQVFSRFSRAHKGAVKGTGLGLAIVKRLVDLHNGKVWVQDNPDGGAVFIVELPKSGVDKIDEEKITNKI